MTTEADEGPPHRHGPASRSEPRARAELTRERAYVRTVERRFNALRESGLYLSPRDFALLLDWHERGVPVEIVVTAIEEVFRRAEARSAVKKIQSIHYCRRAVEEVWEERRAAMLGAPAAGPARGALSQDEVSAYLEAAAAATEAAAAGLGPESAAPDPGSGADPPAGAHLDPAAGNATRSESLEQARIGLLAIASRLRTIRASQGAPGGADLQEIERELASLEGSAAALAVSALAPADLAALRHDVEESLAPFASRMSARARSATEKRAIEGEIRRRCGLPRYSLLTLAR